MKTWIALLMLVAAPLTVTAQTTATVATNADVTFTKPLSEVGGGLGIAIGRGDIDLSYRFRKFLETGEPVNVSGVYVAGGVSF